ncbi:gamma-glutamyl-gamma-aminobutyrate hydrolase family protein [Actinomadura syzygii]|uniref:Gamma-glutamyl-gamma-aminobutyrate hydrolase family protein n=1 Tax=Actinomadura syzygii TaxID=1427538 RepID=A0A5D0TXG4_9ACTN|nr:gamma-glutamyl-gamma-aminobutyrate hydrolase family protein [Actinomadura syzygii]
MGHLLQRGRDVHGAVAASRPPLDRRRGRGPRGRPRRIAAHRRPARPGHRNGAAGLRHAPFPRPRAHQGGAVGRRPAAHRRGGRRPFHHPHGLRPGETRNAGGAGRDIRARPRRSRIRRRGRGRRARQRHRLRPGRRRLDVEPLHRAPRLPRPPRRDGLGQLLRGRRHERPVRRRQAIGPRTRQIPARPRQVHRPEDDVDRTVTGPTRPLIALPARFSESASALRYRAEVAARALVEAVFQAGGEPFVMHPAAPFDASRLARCDGVLLPGGGDLHPRHYGEKTEHEALYDVDDEQDEFDLALAAHVLEAGVPTLAICRGLQIVNTVLGGTLNQHMPRDHRHKVHSVNVKPGTLLAKTLDTEETAASCYHHQSIATLAPALTPTAFGFDGTIEGAELAEPGHWFLAVQWHPEDTAATDRTQQALFSALVQASARSSAQGRRR